MYILFRSADVQKQTWLRLAYFSEYKSKRNSEKYVLREYNVSCNAFLATKVNITPKNTYSNTTMYLAMPPPPSLQGTNASWEVILLHVDGPQD